MKTISIPEDLHKEIVKLKLDLQNKNAAELIRTLILAYKETRFLEFSRKFRQKLEEKKIGFNELLKKSRKIREEIADEWFP